jgi:hypothetical protein
MNGRFSYAVSIGLLTLLGACSQPTVAQTVYYVATDGNNAHAGASNTPLATIREALNRAHAGDTVVVRDGTYRESPTTVRGGTSAARITFEAENPGRVTITQAGRRVMDIRHPWLTIRGLAFDGQFGDADIVRVRSTADHLVFANNEVFNGAQDGIDLGTNQDDGARIGPDFDFLEDVTISGSKVHHFLRMIDGERDDAHGIVAGGVRDFEIRDTEVYYVSGDALQLQDGGWDDVTIERVNFWNAPLPRAMAGFKAGVNPGENAIDTKQDRSISTRGRLTVKHSKFSGWNGRLIGMPSALNLKEKIEAVLEGNILHHNDVACRLRGRAEDAGAHVTVINNVFHQNRVAVRYEDRINNLHLLNNTFGAENDRFFVSAPSATGVGRNFQVLTNLFLGEKLPKVAGDPSNLAVGSKEFLDASAHDYHLRISSSAVDSGLSLDNVTLDHDGTPRPVGGGQDVGAFEFQKVSQ